MALLLRGAVIESKNVKNDIWVSLKFTEAKEVKFST